MTRFLLVPSPAKMRIAIHRETTFHPKVSVPQSGQRHKTNRPKALLLLGVAALLMPLAIWAARDDAFDFPSVDFDSPAIQYSQLPATMSSPGCKRPWMQAKPRSNTIRNTMATSPVCSNT